MEHPTLHRLLEYLDDSLDPYTSAAVQLHVTGCTDCARELELQRSIMLSSRQALETSISPACEQRILTAVAPARTTPKRMRQFRFSFGDAAFGLFLAAFLLITIMVLFRSESKPDSGSVNTIARETVSILESWNGAATQLLRSTLEPLRLHVPGPAVSTILLVFPILLILYLVDRFLQRIFRTRS